jgi:hypothetical protein
VTCLRYCNLSSIRKKIEFDRGFTIGIGRKKFKYVVLDVRCDYCARETDGLVLLFICEYYPIFREESTREGFGLT